MAEMKYASKGALLADATLKAYYRMESGALTTDSSGNGKTLTNNNSVGEGTGNFGGCADFGTANTNKDLRIADALSWAGNNSYSFSCWVKIRTEISADGTIYQFVNNAENTQKSFLQLFYQQSAGVKKVTFQRFKNVIGGQSSNYTVTLGTTNWHHLVGTYDATNVRLWVNGVLRDTQAASGSGLAIVTEGFGIGANLANVQYANAYIDDVAIFSKCLVESEILALYNDLSADVNTLTNYRPRRRTSGAVSV